MYHPLVLAVLVDPPDLEALADRLDLEDQEALTLQESPC
jgi:hypothetical protein